MLTRFIIALAIMSSAAMADSYRIINHAWVDVTVHHCHESSRRDTILLHLGTQTNIHIDDACDGWTWVNIQGVKWLKVKHFNDDKARAIEIHGTAFGTNERYLIEPTIRARPTFTNAHRVGAIGTTQNGNKAQVEYVFNTSITAHYIRDTTPGVPKW